MSFVLKHYRPEDAERWDTFVGRAWNGTILHTRRFLGYHGDRYLDLSLIVEAPLTGAVLAVFPAAREPDDASVVTSHPGLTYGGLVRDGGLSGEDLVLVLGLLIARYRELGFGYLRYRAVPHGFHRYPAQDDLYALFRFDAKRYRCDLGAILELGDDGLRKPRIRAETELRAQTELARGAGLLPSFWPVLEESLETRHGTKPVHTVGEILDLSARFPRDLECFCLRQRESGAMLAGVVIFKVIERTWHAQYIAASADGHARDATKLLLLEIARAASSEGAKCLSLGISSEEGGRRLNRGLYTFKSRLSAGGMAHESYEIELNNSPPAKMQR